MILSAKEFLRKELMKNIEGRPGEKAPKLHEFNYSLTTFTVFTIMEKYVAYLREKENQE